LRKTLLRIFCVKLFYAFSGCLLRTMYAFKNIEFRFQLKQIYVRKYKGVFSIYHQKITEVFGNLFIIQLVSTQYVYELVFIFCVFLFHQYSWIFYTSLQFRIIKTKRLLVWIPAFADAIEYPFVSNQKVDMISRHLLAITKTNKKQWTLLIDDINILRS
jgi:hypothetical protein